MNRKGVLQVTKSCKIHIQINEEEWPTCVPDILYPNIGAGSEKQPLYWYEEQTYYIWCECYTNKKYWKGLEERRGGRKKSALVYFSKYYQFINADTTMIST